MVEILIDTFEELKKYIFIINRNDKDIMIVKFQNSNFYHLVGLHKIKNFDNYFPNYIKSKDKQYKYIKKNIKKFNNILENQLKEKDTLSLRVKTFSNILDLLKNNNASLYNLKPKTPYSLYDGDYGLMKMYEKDICCLLGLKVDEKNNNITNCIPNSWMASKRINKLVEFKRPIFIKNISYIPMSLYNPDEILF